MKAIFRIIRPLNLLIILLTMMFMQYMIAAPLLKDWALLPAWMLCLAALGVILIAAGGYVINDYFDVKIDLINRPDKLIVTRDITKQQAMLMHQILTALGIACGLALAIILRSWTLALIYIFIPGLLWFYSSAYKRQFIIGNLIVSFAAGMVPLIVAIANIAFLRRQPFGWVLSSAPIGQQLYAWIGAFALMAFLCTWIREILKDMQDQAGDRELECHTLPIRIGNKGTKIVLTVLILLTCALLCYGVFGVLGATNWHELSVRYLVFGLLVPFVCLLYILWTGKIASDYRLAQHFMKFIMLLGTLYSIVFFTLLK